MNMDFVMSQEFQIIATGGGRFDLAPMVWNKSESRWILADLETDQCSYETMEEAQGDFDKALFDFRRNYPKDSLSVSIKEVVDCLKTQKTDND